VLQVCHFMAGIYVHAGDLLPSWYDTALKRAITTFVERVTTEGSAGFEPDTKRITTFDNDGTLWPNNQFTSNLPSQHPDGKRKEACAWLLKGDTRTVLAGGQRGILDAMAATHTGVTTEKFGEIATGWRQQQNIRRAGGRIRRWFISQCSNCSTICVRTDLRPS
jgi:hypothetical protein